MWGVEGETHDDGEAVDDTGDEDIDDREDGEMIGEHFPLSLLPMGTLAQLRSSASVTETSEALVTLGKFIKILNIIVIKICNLQIQASDNN